MKYNKYGGRDSEALLRKIKDNPNEIIDVFFSFYFGI